MKDMKKIKEAFERNEQALLRQPSLGQKSGTVKVRLDKGLRCEIEGVCWQFASDMPVKVGGDQTAPSPGFYVAGALGSCIAIMAKMWASRLDIPIKSIEIDVFYEVDMSMLFGVNDTPARWKSISYEARVNSPASEKDIQKVLELAHQYSHVRGDLEYAFHIRRKKVKPLT